MPEVQQPDKLDFHYRRGPNFRTVHADGIWAAISPRGGIQMAFFTQSYSIPEIATHAITEEGAVGKEINRYEQRGVVRELEINVVMDLADAESYVALLQERIQQAKGELPTGEQPTSENAATAAGGQ